MKYSTGWPPKAERLDLPGWPDQVGPGNVGLWDIATIHEIDAMQSLPTLAAGLSKSYRCRNGTSDLPSEADSRYAAFIDLGGHQVLRIAPIEAHKITLRSRPAVALYTKDAASGECVL